MDQCGKIESLEMGSDVYSQLIFTRVPRPFNVKGRGLWANDTRTPRCKRLKPGPCLRSYSKRNVRWVKGISERDKNNKVLLGKHRGRSYILGNSNEILAMTTKLYWGKINGLDFIKI